MMWASCTSVCHLNMLQAVCELHSSTVLDQCITSCTSEHEKKPGSAASKQSLPTWCRCAASSLPPAWTSSSPLCPPAARPPCGLSRMLQLTRMSLLHLPSPSMLRKGRLHVGLHAPLLQAQRSPSRTAPARYGRGTTCTLRGSTSTSSGTQGSRQNAGMQHDH